MIYLTQILMIGYALCAAWMQSCIVRIMRDYVPINNPISRSFHRAGACMTVSVSLLCVLGSGWLQGAVGIILHLVWYWFVFDISLNLMTGKKWDYTGDTAAIDRWIKEGFEEETGRIKAFGCLVIIVLLNLIQW